MGLLANEYTAAVASGLLLYQFMAFVLVLPLSFSILLFFRWLRKRKTRKVTPLATNHVHEKHQFLILKNACRVPKIGIHLEQGNRPYMEDTVSVYTDSNISIFALFDGHGGSQVSLYAAKELPAIIASELKMDKDLNNGSLVEQSISSTFLAVDERIMKAGWPDGSTAIVVVVAGQQIIVANLGDSRAVLACVRRVSEGKEQIEAVALSIDHKPNTPSERKRIEEKGGFVTNSYGTFRVNGVLATSRALGDAALKPVVAAEPEILRITVNKEEHRFLVLGSDGLFDVMDNQCVVEFAYSCLLEGNTVAEATQLLVKEAIERGSMDNVSAILVML